MDKASSVVRPDVLNENKHSIHAFLRQSYSQVRNHIQEGFNVFKDELRGFRQSAEACMDFFAMPVNNYIKDIDQIDQDFRQGPDSTPFRVVNIAEAASMKGPMEENY